MPDIVISADMLYEGMSKIFEGAKDAIVTAITTAFAAERTSAAENAGKELEGLREQILANAAILLPILSPECVVDFIGNDGKKTGARTIPKLHIALAAIDENYQACVVHGHDTSRYKAKFIFVDSSSKTPTQALRKLLDVTSTLLKQHFFNHKFLLEGVHTKIEGGGYCTSDPKHSPDIVTDTMWWGKRTSPASSQAPSFRSDVTEIDSEDGLKIKNMKPSRAKQAENIKREDSGIRMSGNPCINAEFARRKDFPPGVGTWNDNGIGINWNAPAFVNYKAQSFQGTPSSAFYPGGANAAGGPKPGY